MSRRRLLIICPYPIDTAPGQRFRFEQYLEMLAAAGIEVTMKPFLSPRTLTVLYQPGRFMRKATGVMAGCVRRAMLLPWLRKFDYVLLHREAAPLGPPVFEWMMFLLGARIIYDFDDAIFVPNQSVVGSRLVSLTKWTSKVTWITKRSRQVTVCNQFLKDWASQFNDNVVVLPTTVGEHYFEHHKTYGAEKMPVIGWTGSYSTAKYLELVRPVLVKLQERYEFEFVVVCNYDPGFSELKRYRFIRWRSATEVEDLSNLDIGVMPVPAGTWEKGKVGLKAIQYSALGVVPVVSSVGSGPEVVQNGKTGLVVENSEEAWYSALAWLLEHRSCWHTIGRCAREYVFHRYSVAAQAPVYISLFQ
ncbi:MAG: glycosyltransferase [Candidatus Binataceae bacterium]